MTSLSHSRFINIVDSICFSLINEINHVNGDDSVPASLSLKNKEALTICLAGLLPLLEASIDRVLTAFGKTENKAEERCSKTKNTCAIRSSMSFSADNVDKYVSVLKKHLQDIDDNDFLATLSYKEINTLKVALRCLLPRMQESVERLRLPYKQAKQSATSVRRRKTTVMPMPSVKVTDVTFSCFPISNHAMPAAQAER